MKPSSVVSAASTPEASALIAALRRRDPAALQTLFESSADRLYRLARGILHDDQQADGVVQTAFVRLLENIDTFEGRSSVETWLYRVAYHEALQRLRRTRPEQSLDAFDDSDETLPRHFVDWNTLPETLLLGAEAREQMEAAIAALSPTQRAVFTLRDIEELSTEHTAEILGLTEANVKVALHRARLALRERLAAYFEERAHPPRAQRS